MEIKSHASLEFLSKSIPDKIVFGGSVVAELIAHPLVFPNLPHTILVLTADNTDLQNKSVAAATGDFSATAAMHLSEKKWETDYRDTANYVSTVANGNEETIRNGGFIPTKSETTPTQAPGALINFDVMVNKASGSFHASSDPLKGVAGYAYLAVPDGVTLTYNGDQVEIEVGGKKIYLLVDTHRKANFNNVDGGVKLNVSCYAVNRAGSGPAADPQDVIPQV